MKGVSGIFAALILTTNLFGQAGGERDYQAENDPYSAESTHYIGEYYGGGIVFHVSEDGQHGLICAVVDESTRKQRQNNAFTDTINFSGGVAGGKILTEGTITSGDTETEYVPVLADRRDDNLSDWELATRYDLNKLYLNRHVIGGYGDFATGWKKIEVSSLNTWFQSFMTGARFTNGKDDQVYVRVVRKF